MPQDTKDRVSRLMEEKPIADFLEEYGSGRDRTRDAISYLIEKHPDATDRDVVLTVRRLLKPLRDQKVTVFCSYKKRDQKIAEKLEEWFGEWSADKLVMKHMAAIKPGEEWRERIVREIPESDWFLLLLPGPEADRDWLLFEAGYFRPGRTLERRFVCLHHPDPGVTDALGNQQSVPAEQEAVENFLRNLFVEPNWLPGLPPICKRLGDLPVKARMIVELVTPPTLGRCCCGAHMQVKFDETSRLGGWALLASGHVNQANDECRELFDVARNTTPPSFGKWLKDVDGARRDAGWVRELAEAIQALGEQRRERPLKTVLSLAEGRFVQPKICAITRRVDDSLEAVDLLFLDAAPPQNHTQMSPGFSALATAMQFGVEFRSLLEASATLVPGREQMRDFESGLLALERRAFADPRLPRDPKKSRELMESQFEGEEKEEVGRIFDRWEELRRLDGQGELDQALGRLDSRTFQELIGELREINQHYLELTSSRFSSIASSPDRAWSHDASLQVVEREDAPLAEPATAPMQRPIDPRTIAVLPFENMSDDPQDLFAAGMTEEIISGLSKVPDLLVVSRYSVLGYRKTSKTLDQIARELRVARILEGSVRREEDRVRITGQLIDAETGTHLWSETYERELDDVFAVQANVAESIVGALDLQLSPDRRQVFDVRPTDNLTAYSHYLKGKALYNRYRKDDNEKAIEHFEAAIGEDPDYALAYAALARCLYQRAARFGFPKSESLDESLRHSDRAIALDPTLAEALAAQGTALGAFGLTAKALEAQRKAVEIKPSYLLAVMNIGVTYEDTGRLDEAVRWKKRALALDPLSSHSCSQLGVTYASLGMDDDAGEWFQRAIDQDGESVQARAFWAELFLARGDDDQAIEQAERVLTLSPGEPMGLCAAGRAHWFAGRDSEAKAYFRQIPEKARIPLAHLHWAQGRHEKAEELLAPLVAFLEEALDRGGDAAWIHHRLAAVHALRGETDRAYELLDKAIAAGEVDFRTLQRLPVFKGMREEERFQQVLEIMRKRIAEMRLAVEAQEAA